MLRLERSKTVKNIFVSVRLTLLYFHSLVHFLALVVSLNSAPKSKYSKHESKFGSLAQAVFFQFLPGLVLKTGMKYLRKAETKQKNCFKVRN